MQRLKTLFDLNGFVVVRGVLSAEEVAAANAAIDTHSFHERLGSALRNSGEAEAFAGTDRTGRLDMAGMLGWGSSKSAVFRRMLAHPGLVPTLHALLGEGYRLDHAPLVLAQVRGSEGFSLHGGPVTSDGRFVPELQYVCKHGRIHNSLLGVSFQLTDHNPGDGGFCAVRGSHKMEFPPTPEMLSGEDADFFESSVYQPATKAGDVVLFSEATVHGCLPWMADTQRRVALFRFAPSTCGFARGYSGGWPEAFTADMPPEQLAVMQPPYNVMYDRARLDVQGGGQDGGHDDGHDNGSDVAVKSSGRSQEKKAFDKEVFETPYY